MKLTVTSRTGVKKSDVKQIRREGNVPGVIYAPGKTPEMVTVSGSEYGALLRKVKPGQLPTTVFTLVSGSKERKAIVKEVQYEITRYEVSHLDFEELKDDVLVKVKVPITIVGAADCVGVKLGGTLRQVVRFIEVECLPKNIPAEFVVDVKDLGIAQVKRVEDLGISEKVHPLAKKEEVVVVVAKQ